MTDKKTVGISSLIALGIVLASIITPTFFDNTQFYCEIESSIKECPGDLSGGTHTRCYLNEEKTSWDYCKSGWISVTNDLIIQEEPINYSIEKPSNYSIEENLDNSLGIIKYTCNQKECIQIIIK